MSVPYFHIYRQLEQSDCGMACIRMIARYYGKKISLKTLKGLSETSKLGVTLLDITSTFRKICMESASLRISLGEIYRMPCPAVVYWQQRHFVVLYYIDRKKDMFYIADPAEGKVKISGEEFAKYWKGDANKGVVVVAEPGDNFENIRFPQPNILRGLVKVISVELGRHKKSFSKIILLSLLCMLADLIIPLMLQKTVDSGIAGHNINMVWMLITGQLMVFLGNAAASNVVQYLMVKLSMNVNIDMTRQYLKRIIGFPLSYFDRRTSADLIQKIDDQSRIKDFLMQLPGSTFFVILNLIVFSGLMIWYNIWLFLFFLTLTLCEILWTFLFLRPRRNLDYAYFSRMAENRNNVYEMINGMMEIKASGAHHSRMRKWESTQIRLIDFSLRSTLLTIWMSGGQAVIARVKEIVITGICATYVINGGLTFGEMLTISYIVGRLSGPFRSIISMIGQIQDACISYERLDEVINDDSEKQGNKGFTHSEIEFENVGFRYSGSSSPFIIDDLCLNIESGKTTAIVGESGCGKTTLIKLMLGFYTPQRGRLRLSGIDIVHLNRDEWLEHCGVVMQSGFIFSDTIVGNIAMSGDDIDIQKVKDAIEIVGMGEFIDSLPMGYDTRIGATGVELSGGQKQRLLIARAIYKRPEILFLDEATSSLDATNERLVTERIRNMQRGKTLIVAAHRLSTIRNADRILYMERGKILEDGTHEELIEKRGRYYDLVFNQLEQS